MTKEIKLKEYIIDGAKFKNFEEFTICFSKTVLVNHKWRGSLDAFNDILYGGFGTPESGFKIRWVNASKSKLNLGKTETIIWYTETLKTCHPTNQQRLREKLKEMEKGNGETLFDWIIDIIKSVKGINEWNKGYKVELEIEY